MPLTIKNERGCHKPIIVCDHCGRQIDTAEDGNYQWDMDAAKGGAVMLFTHKECCHAFEQLRPGICWGAMELLVLPVYLVNNLKVDMKKATRNAKLLALIG